MSSRWPKPGINHVGEYQASGHTLAITGSSNTIYLNYVASSITLSATAQANVVFYDAEHNGIGFTVPADGTAHFKGKFLTLDVPANVDALIEVTNIPSSSYVSGSAPIYADLHRTS